MKYPLTFKARMLMLVLLPLAILTACKDDEEGTLIVRFIPEYDGQPLKTFDILPFDAPERISFTHMSFYASDIALLKGSEHTGIRDIELVDLSFDNTDAATEGYAIVLDGIKAGKYSGFEFGVGVPPGLNDDQPADFPSTNPLSKVSYYWDAWDSYIFMKTEGRLDTLGNGNPDLGFAIHTGSDPLYRVLTGQASIEIVDGGATEIHVVIDYKTLLSGLDIKHNPQNHSPTDTVVIGGLVNNLSQAVSLRL
jgi:hypothetical protein